MYLDEAINSLTGVLIGVINGLYGEIAGIEDTIREAIIALKSSDTSVMKYYTSKLEAIKEKEFPNCKSCANPCGRTNNFYLNDIEDEIIRSNRITELKNFLASYNSETTIDVISYNFSKLCW